MSLPEWELWACALTVERHYGERGPVYIAERIGALASAGDEQGVATWKAIAACYRQLLRARAAPPH